MVVLRVVDEIYGIGFAKCGSMACLSSGEISYIWDSIGQSI